MSLSVSFFRQRRPRTQLRSVLVSGAMLLTGMWPMFAHAQILSPQNAAAAARPEPVYWKQNLFLIPYQWSTSADPGAAQSVWLLVSKDRGATWQKISEAAPQVKAFNYHAEGDGEYWFAIRTLDRSGRALPQGPYQPELCVIVDTTMPRIESLAAQYRSDGALEIQWRGSDQNLDPGSWKFEIQLDATGTWQPLSLEGLRITPLAPPNVQTAVGVSDGQTAWQPPPGSQPRALRATVCDRAGNSAAYGTAIAEAPPATTAASESISVPGFAPPVPLPANASAGWVSASAAPPAPLQAAAPTASQPWPVGAVASAPFRLSAGAVLAPGDQVTSYGSPPGVGTPLGTDHISERETPAVSRIDPQYDGRAVTPLEPYREMGGQFRRALLTRLPPIDDALPLPLNASSVEAAAPRPAEPAVHPPAGIEPKRVGSRTFALEYKLEEFGRRGIGKVELWGTRDGGQTWCSYATDDDHRSPAVVTVDSAGLYGFRMVVESAGGGVADPPRSGDVPELWVDVDLNQPVAELTAIRPGAGNLADHVVLEWRAVDDNLEPRPISLFYSSRPAGPWSAIATNLENTGQYAWQVQRHVPERCYLRLEARDRAGNLAAFQTREPVILTSAQPVGRLVAPASIGAQGW